MNAIPAGDDIPCERCGRCLAVCPVYDVERIETLSPRGRLDLIRGLESCELVTGPRYHEALFSCMQCLACFDACPKGVDASGRILTARTRLTARDRVKSRLERAMLRTALNHRPLLAGLARLASQVQQQLPAKEGPGSRHLPMFLPDLLAGRRIPEISAVNLFRGLPEVLPADPGADYHGQVTFFTGCYFGLVETGPILSALRVLAFNGWEVLIPRTQSCCGAVALLAGHADLARRLVARNLAALAGDGLVITSCATCGRTLRREYPGLLKISGDDSQLRAATALARRTRDIHVFLEQLPELRQGVRAQHRRVTIHDPCHLSRGQGVREQVRRILAAVPGVELVEMANSDTCCGGGGLSGMKQPALSLAIGEKKIAAIEATGADTVVAGCPGCLMQIRDLLSRRGSRIQALHPMDLLAWSYETFPRQGEDGCLI